MPIGWQASCTGPGVSAADMSSSEHATSIRSLRTCAMPTEDAIMITETQALPISANSVTVGTL